MLEVRNGWATKLRIAPLERLCVIGIIFPQFCKPELSFLNYECVISYVTANFVTRVLERTGFEVALSAKGRATGVFGAVLYFSESRLFCKAELKGFRRSWTKETVKNGSQLGKQWLLIMKDSITARLE